jgi:translation initiation factor 2B subunit (eIF-2B alpha/beta/delta family)
MGLYDADTEEKIRLLKEWRDSNQKDLDEYQSLVDIQLEKKRLLEAKLARKLRPINRRISIFQKFVNSFTNKKNKINEEIKKLEESS